jgi:glycogen(starch) synthase
MAGGARHGTYCTASVMARILALTNMYPPHHLGGYELQCRDILDRFRARGHDCTLLTSIVRVAGVADPPNERAEGTRRDLGIYWADHEVIRPPIRERLQIERANQAHLQRALADARPDVISVWHMGAMSLGMLTTLKATGIPLVYVVCDDWLTYVDYQDAWMRLWRFVPHAVKIRFEKRLGVPCTVPNLGETGTFCFVSAMTRQSADGGHRSRYPDNTIVYSGIDTDDFPVSPAPNETRAGATKKIWSWRLLNVGRVDPRKGLDTAIRALALLPPQATLDVVGRGDEGHLADLQNLAAELGVADRVRWSTAPRDQLKAVYAAADVFVFPVTWDEPFGLVPLEAMACGTAVVATGTGGSGEFLIDGWNSLRFGVEDPTALAQAIVRLAEDPALRNRLTEAGRRTAAELTIDRLADVLEAWHVAAAARFADGRPPHRPALSDLLTNRA